MPPRPIRSPLALIALGLLAEQPLHPYAIGALMRERGHDRLVKLKAASLYDTVGRLAKADLIEIGESTRSGRRPERTVYRITQQGLTALQNWVRDGLGDPRRPEAFPAALSFMFALSREEVIALIEKREVRLDTLIDTSERAVAEACAAGVDPIFLSEESYGQALRRAERQWLETFTSHLRSGSLGWPRPGPCQEEGQEEVQR